mgnify:CR=1 FL=1
MRFLSNKHFLLTALLFLAVLPSWSQVNLGENIKLGLSGNASFGYLGTFSEVDTSQTDAAFVADLTCSYYSPQFLQFRITPYYNESRLNSNYSSITGGKGISAVANLFSGSHIPLDVSFSKDYNSEGDFNVPGSVGAYRTRGDSQTLNIGWSFLSEKLPSVHVGYGLSSSNYQLLGSDSNGSGDSHIFSVGSGYRVAGFNLSGLFSDSTINQTIPTIASQTTSFNESTNQKSEQFSVNRRLFDSANWNLNFNRSTMHTDYTGTPSDETFDSVSTGLSLSPIDKLTLNFALNYTTNLSALVLTNILTTSVNPALSSALSSSEIKANAATEPVGAATANYSSDYLEYGVRASYNLTDNLIADGSFDRRSQSTFVNTAFTTNTSTAGLTFSHPLAGGQFGAHYGLSVFTSDTANETALGNFATINYSHLLWNWQTTSGFQLSRSTETAYLNYTQTGYGFDFGASHALAGAWRIALTARVGKSMLDGVNNSDTLYSGYSVAISGRRFSFGGGYNRSSGNSLQSLNGLVSTPVTGQILLPTLLVMYRGDSYYGSGAYHPTKYLRLVADYSHVRYSTNSSSSISNNLMNEFDIKSEYEFRQLRFTTGYSHINQGVGTMYGTPVTIDTVYAGVSRHFDFF